MEDRKKEIEYWVTERATMRQMIDQLENQKVESEAFLENQVSKDSSSPLRVKDAKKMSKKEKEKAEAKKAKDLKRKISSKLK